MQHDEVEDLAFDEPAHDHVDFDEEECRYVVMREGDALTIEVHIGELEAGHQLQSRPQLFDMLDEFLDSGGVLRMERRS